VRHQWEYGSLGRELSRHRQCRRCRTQQRSPANGLWHHRGALEWQSPASRGWKTGAPPACLGALAVMPRETEWRRVEDEHPRWEISNPLGDGRGFLCTDAAIRAFGRKHMENLLHDLPPLPGRAWEVLGG
jgi:hypothetical protein